MVDTVRGFRASQVGESFSDTGAMPISGVVVGYREHVKSGRNRGFDVLRVYTESRIGCVRT
jgi:hypothetical protein